MNRLRNRLIAIFLAATLAPLGVTLWITADFLGRSLAYSSASEVAHLSQVLRRTGASFYQRACDDLKGVAAAGKVKPMVYKTAEREVWPDAVNDFFDSGEPERFALSGIEGDRLDYYLRRPGEVRAWSQELNGVAMGALSREIARAQEMVDYHKSHDVRRGLVSVFVILTASVWLLTLALLVYLAHRVSEPIQGLTAGLGRLAAGDLDARVPVGRDDEIGHASRAFNDTAARLKESTGRLVYLTQMASWQMLARKMAHELKNSLTPIRLTVEEMLARHGERDRGFMEQAAQIVVEEVESLERRIRAFSQFASEPPVRLTRLDLNTLVEERIAFLSTAHPETQYSARLAEGGLWVAADADLVRGILTNLLENGAQAAGDGGRVLAVAFPLEGKAAVEVHDNGPGLSEQVRDSLFQPTISFKKGGMGLGLSISRKSALLLGGEIEVVKGELGGAAFRVLLPVAGDGNQARSDSG